MSRRIALGLLLLVAACGGADVPDTSCIEPEVAAEQVRFASMVLLGEVTAWDGTTAEFEVEEIWRGPDVPDKIEIIPEPGRAFTAGQRYLVFPTNHPSPLNDEPCSATVRWTDELAELRPTTARVPADAPAQDADLPWEWVIAAGVLAAAVGLTRRVIDRRRHPEPDWDPDFTFGDGS